MWDNNKSAESESDREEVSNANDETFNFRMYYTRTEIAETKDDQQRDQFKELMRLRNQP